MSTGAFTPRELADRLQRGEIFTLLDVREPGEFALCRLPGSRNVPLGELRVGAMSLDPDAPIVCICHHGVRSAHALGELARLGFTNLHNLSGGVDRWALEVDPAMARYGRFQERG